MKNMIAIILFCIGGIITISNVALAIRNAKIPQKKEESYKPSPIPLVDSFCYIAGFLIINFKNMSFLSWGIAFLLLIIPMLLFAYTEIIMVKLLKK